MYFKSRAEAGQLLAAEIVKKYHGKDCTVVALSDGGVMVGAQVAMKIHSVLTMLLTESITLPRENEALAGISQDGSFTYNSVFSPGQIEDFVSEYYGYIEQEKMHRMRDINHQLGKGRLITKELLRDHNVILITDGLPNGFSLDIAVQFLKPIHYKKLIIATPLASVNAVDRMHVLADDIFCLSVITDYISTDHYYDIHDVPDHDTVVKTIENIISHWQ